VALARGTERRLGRVQAGLARRDPTADFRLELAEAHRRLRAMAPDLEAEEVDAAVVREVTELCARAFDPKPLGAEELEPLRVRVHALLTLLGRSLRDDDGSEGPAEDAGTAPAPS
jgi:DNA-binding transcriptional LysR family regulator